MKFYQLIALVLGVIGISILGVTTTRSLSTSLYLKVPETPLLSTADSFEPLEDCSSCHFMAHWSWNGSAHRDVACDACHGKVGEHLSLPSNSTIRSQVPKDVCIHCHGSQEVLPVWWQDFLGNPDKYLAEVHKANQADMYLGDVERHLQRLIAQKIPIVIEVFVSLHCPSTQSLLKDLVPWIKHLPNVTMKVYHIAYEAGYEDKEIFFNSQPHGNEFFREDSCSEQFEEDPNGIFQTRFGREELDQAIDWAIVQELHFMSWLDFLQCASQDIVNGDRLECFNAAGINPSEFYEQKTVYGEQTFFQNMSEAYFRRVRVSPTVFINGVRYEYPLNAATMVKTLCAVIPSLLCSDYPHECGENWDCRALGSFSVCDKSGEFARCVSKKGKSLRLNVILPQENFQDEPNESPENLASTGL